jgi:hypothetical protein
MSRARDLSKLSSPSNFTVDTNNNIGVNSTTPDAKFDVVGVVSATKYFGDGSELTGITAGATLSAGSGDQKVVLTSKTAGQVMTTAGIDAELTYNSTSNTLSATTFNGALSGNATSATNAQGLTGTPDITVRNIIGVGATFSGVLTYEDVTNIDSVGIVTAQQGIKVLAGGINAVGVVTATSFVGSGISLTNLPASGDSNDITACLFI